MKLTLPLVNNRVELKYRINYFQYLKIRNAITPFMKKDYYTLKAPGVGYLVRSLYFDTYSYDSYHEKMSGDCDRVKIRLRTYSEVLNDQSIIKAELKVRKANLVEKHSTLISVEQYRSFIQHRRWADLDDPVLIEFVRLLHIKELYPQVLIEYERESYESRSREGIRITFDHGVRSNQAKNLFPGHLFMKSHNNQTKVLEIKFREDIPFWLQKLAKEHGLKILANSKFTQGIQVGKQDLHYPDGIVVIR